jgi:CRISPR-associated protein Cas2
MIVLTLTDCPSSLRGDLTRWLFEVDTNLYVGKQSARVREKIWERVVKNADKGRAVMVYPANNEQGFDFRVHGETWQPIDFDGLKLMLRPSRISAQPQLKPGFSKAAKRQTARRFVSKQKNSAFPQEYIVVDVETTGLSAQTDEIIEIGAIKVRASVSDEEFQALVRIRGGVSEEITKLTGITDQELLEKGRELGVVLPEFLEFAGYLPLVSHNIGFDLGFIRAACERCELPAPGTMCIDTLRLARKTLEDPPDFKLGTLLKYLEIEPGQAHRSIGDCISTKLLYEKLRGIACGEDD